MAATTQGRPTREVTAKPRNDAYTGLLFISFLALVISSVLLFLDYNQYGNEKPQKLSLPAIQSSTVTPAGDAGPPPPPPPMETGPMNP